MQLEGIHHITAITGDAPAQRRLLRSRARPAAGQEDGQPGRPDASTTCSTPTSRAVAGADLTFFEYPGARRGRAGAGMVHRIVTARRLGRCARLLGRAAGRRGRRDGALAATACSFADPEGLAHELVVVDDARRAARGARTARSRPSSRCRASRACAPTARDPSPQRALLERGARLHRGRRRPCGRRAATRAAGSTTSTRARGARHRRAPAPCTTWPAPRPTRTTRAGASACARRAAPDARDRPLLLPLDLLPRAGRRAVRDRDARARASRPTSRCSASASTSRCRRTSSICARASSRC